MKQPTIASFFGWIYKLSLYFPINISAFMLTGNQTLQYNESQRLLGIREICGSGLKINELVCSSIKKNF